MEDKNFDFSFIKDEEGFERMPGEETKKTMNHTITISREEFMDKATSVSKKCISQLEEKAKEDGKDLSPLLFLSEMFTHVQLLGALTKELFKEGE